MEMYIRKLQEFSYQQVDSELIEFSVASQTPYMRQDQNGNPYWQVLVISNENIDFQRLKDQKCPFLFEHDTDKQIGVVQKAYIANKKLMVVVRFSENEFAQSVKRDILSGIRRNVSIGYMVFDYLIQQSDDGIPVWRCFHWMPYEVSSVSVPADTNVGYKRSLNKDSAMNKQEEKIEAVEQEKIEKETPEQTVEEKETQAVEQVKQDIKNDPEQTAETVEVEKEEEQVKPAQEDEIRACGQLAQDQELAEKCIQEKRSLAEFKALLKQKRNSKNSKTNKEKSMEKFSISKAIRNACSQYKKDVSDQFETKVIAENKRNLGIGEEADIVLTKKELTRALAPTATNGAELIQTDYLPSQFTPAARPALTLEETGYYSIPVEGNAVSFAVVTSGSAAGMYDLDGELADGDMHFANRTLTPHKAGVCIPIPYSLILQARPEIDAIVQDDMVKALDEIRDAQILTGTGTSGQVVGIVNTDGVNTLSAAASALYTWQGVLSMEQKIRDANEFGYLNFVMNSNDYKKFASTLKDEVNSYAGWILEDGKIKDYRVFVNNSLADGQIILGDFSQVVVADFDGLMIKVDDITYIKKQAIQIVATKAFDVCLRRPKAFCVTTLNT